jgi:glycosyltransferase involved in cell wall biosynthesis
MNLTITIPTFNRCKKLDKTLTNLLKQILDSKNKNHVKVFVSDNGSFDSTVDVLSHQNIKYTEQNIKLIYHSFKVNEGFDKNIYKCYDFCDTDYLWFLSDDDLFDNNAIDQIFNDILLFNPTIIYYNFEQHPFLKLNPYIIETKLHTSFDIIPLKKIINWPKLSSIVLKKINNYDKNNNFNSGYAHVELIIKAYFDNGNLLLSKYFIGQPQNDYLDNIEFPPYIGNNLNTSLLNTLKNINKPEYFDSLRIPYTDPTISSLNTLGCFYRGKHMLTHNLKKELELEIINNILNLPLRIFFNYKFYYELIKYFISLLFYFIMKIFFKKIITRLR